MDRHPATPDLRRPPDSLTRLRRSPLGGLYDFLLQGLIYDPETGERRATDYFTYSQIFDPLAANATETRDIAIESNSDFLVFAAVATSRDPAAGNAPDADLRFTVNLSTTSGRNLFDRAQDAANVFGSAQDPAWWPSPKILYRNRTVQVTLQDLRGAARDIRVAFWGMKIFTTTLGQ